MTATHAQLKHIHLSAITPNKDNPRGIDVPTQDPKLSYLKDSIQQIGIQVPLVVTPRGGSYLLIDGERRYYAAKALGLQDVPAYVVGSRDGKPLSPSDLLFRMFQIHHLREQWGPVQQCRALEVKYKQIASAKDILPIQDPRVQVKAIAEHLVNDFLIDERTASDRVEFLRWPDAVKQSLYEKPDEPGYWYICEIEEKIIIPALLNYPEYFEKVPADEVRKDLFAKLRVSLERATEVRKVAPYFRTSFSKASDRNRVTAVLARLHKNHDMTYGEAQEELEKYFPDLSQQPPPTPRKLLTLMESLDSAIGVFDVLTIKTARGRAKASRADLLVAAEALSSSLDRLLRSLRS